MSRSNRPRVAAFVAWLVVCAGCAAPRIPLAGLWDGEVDVNSVTVPFRFEIVDDGAALEGAFFDGAQRVRSTTARREGNTVRMVFAQYGTELVATATGDRLEGLYQRGSRGAPYPFRAARAAPRVDRSKDEAPDIAGEWTIPHESSKGEKAWRLLVRQSGADVQAAILRVDGDTGTLTGAFQRGTFVVSHFSGARPMLLELTPLADGSLGLLQNRKTQLVAYRTADERARAVPGPSDPLAHSRIKDPNAVFTFSFPDLHGRVVSHDDYRGKVLLVSLTGSWCPNCHDEAPFLADLDRRYRDRGLAVVAFAFEEPDQLKSPTRLKAFMQTYGIAYPVLLAGVPEELAEKVPQAENLNAFPTTIFVGRDGRIRAIHAGFASPASGDFFSKGTEAMTALVERLLAEPGRAGGNTREPA